MNLAEVIGRWIGKVEIVLAGADEDLRDGEQALAMGDPIRARGAAHRVLARAPDSPIGLALLADACDAARLDAELSLTLEDLARRAPSRAEVWVRLARARRSTEAPPEEVRDALVRALAVAESGSDARRDALLDLADLDLAEGNGARAELWLERAALPAASAGAAVRHAEARLLRGDAAGANALLDRVEDSPSDGRAALVRGRARAILGDPSAFAPLLRAVVLDAPGASEALSAAMASIPSDPQVRARVRSVVDAKGEQDLARWRAAFARAEGARDAARKALREALDAGEAAAASPLLEASIDDRDAESLSMALGRFPVQDADPLVADAHRIAEAARGPHDAGTAAALLDQVARISHRRVVPWASALASAAARAWVPAPTGGPEGALTDWPRLLERLDAHARSLSDLESVAAVADLSAERTRPLKLAIVGEFNAGKSTFINALIGADVAPTGVLPTTATLHHLRWAPDPIARIFFRPGHEPPERIVPLADLRGTLRSLDTTGIRRVELLMPIAFLVRVEVLDTPGFNAPDPEHTRVALSAFQEADAAIWLLDATQAMKKSERLVLEEARRSRLPLQLLVNKADRMAPADLEQVMRGVREALAETGIPSLSPPLALSAKRALAGKLGDATALTESGWAAAQQLLDERIVARHAELKERAMRRRAARVVRRLAEQAESRLRGREALEEGLASQARALGQAAAAIERDADRVARSLVGQLTPTATAWAGDLALVFVGRDPAKATQDPILARYRAERAVTTLAIPLARALAALAPESSLTPAQIAPTARALTRAAAEATAVPDPSALLGPLARAAVATFVEQLFALSLAPASPDRTAGLSRELGAFAAALG